MWMVAVINKKLLLVLNHFLPLLTIHSHQPSVLLVGKCLGISTLERGFTWVAAPNWDYQAIGLNESIIGYSAIVGCMDKPLPTTSCYTDIGYIQPLPTIQPLIIGWLVKAGRWMMAGSLVESTHCFDATGANSMATGEPYHCTMLSPW